MPSNDDDEAFEPSQTPSHQSPTPSDAAATTPSGDGGPLSNFSQLEQDLPQGESNGPPDATVTSTSSTNRPFLEDFNHTMWQLKLHALQGYIFQAELQERIDDRHNTISFEGAVVDGQEELSDDRNLVGRNRAERLDYVMKNPGRAAAYDVKKILARITHKYTRQQRGHLFGVKTSTMLQMSKAQSRSIANLYVGFAGLRNGVVFIPKQKSALGRVQTLLHSSVVGMPPMPGRTAGLVVRYQDLPEFRRRWREYCRNLDKPDTSRQPLEIPHSGVSIPLDFRPHINRDPTVLSPNENVPFVGAAVKAFTFLLNAFSNSQYAQSKGLKFDQNPSQPLGGDGLVKANSNPDPSLLELKWGLVKEEQSRNRLHFSFIPARDEGSQLRASPFHPGRTHHFSVYIAESYLYILPCSRYNSEMWTTELKVSQPLDQWQDCRVDLLSSADWVGDLHRIMMREGWRPQRQPSQGDMTFWTSLYEAVQVPEYPDATDGKQQEQPDLIANETSPGHDLQNPTGTKKHARTKRNPDNLRRTRTLYQRMLDAEVDLLNELCAAKGYGVFMKTDVYDTRLPQVLFYGYQWSPGEQYVFFANPGTLPKQPHAASINPFAPVLPIRMSRRGAHRVIFDYLAWPDLMTPLSMAKPVFPGLTLFGMLSSDMDGVQHSSALFPDEVVQHQKYLDDANKKLKVSFDSIHDLYRGISSRQQD